MADIEVLRAHISDMTGLEKLLLVFPPFDIGRSELGGLCRDLSQVLQHLAGPHLKEVLLDITVGSIDKWIKAATPSLGGDRTESDAEEDPPSANLKILEQTLTQPKRVQMGIVFHIYPSEAEKGECFRLALQSKRPEIHSRCVDIKYGWG